MFNIQPGSGLGKANKLIAVGLGTPINNIVKAVTEYLRLKSRIIINIFMESKLDGN